MRTCQPDSPVEDTHYNIVQNNGELAAQVQPHVHWHIVPRYNPHASSNTYQHTSAYDEHVPPLPHPHLPPNDRAGIFHAVAQPPSQHEYCGARASMMPDDAAHLAGRMRAQIAEQFAREGAGFEQVCWTNALEG